MPNARGDEYVVINDSRIIEAINYHEHTSGQEPRLGKGIGILKDKVIASALHNSRERFDPPKCHPETRIAVLERITAWALGGSQPMIWVHGPAGAGKSAIAQTLADKLYAEDRLAASFFFSRTATGQNESTFVIPTIVYQLLHSFPDVRDHVERAIDNDPLIFEKNLSIQIQKLVIGPLQDAYDPCRLPTFPKVIIIDGLDECSSQHGAQKSILTALSTLLSSSGTGNMLLLFVASRPEHEIRDAFTLPVIHDLSATLVLDSHFDPDADIRLYLICKFEEVKRTHWITDAAWPSENAIRVIVEKSSGQFIYASTVVKYITAPQNDPRRCLEVILGLKDPGLDTPYAALDALYTHILSSIGASSIEMAMDVFACLQQENNDDAWNYAPGISTKGHIPFLERHLRMDYSQIYCRLKDLHSILFLPSPNNLIGETVRFYHASFGDYLSDRARSGKFFLNAQEARTRLTFCLFKHVLVSMGTGIDKGSAWWTLVKQTFQYPEGASPNRPLRQYMEAAMRPDTKEARRLLEDLTPIQDTQRTPLLDAVHYCSYKAQILDYLVLCYQVQEPDQTTRFICAAKLFPFRVKAFRSAVFCTRDDCYQHRRRQRVLVLFRQLLRFHAKY